MSEGSQLIIGTPKKIRTLPFNAVLPATSMVTILAGAITFRYRIVEVEIVFKDDAANNLLIYVFTSTNTSAPATGPPPDRNVFSEFSSTPYFIGEGIIKKAETNYEAADGEQYIKVHANNQNAYAQIVNVTVKIEEV